MKSLLNEIFPISPVEVELISIEEVSTEGVDSKEIDSMEVISAEIHSEVIPIVEVTIEETMEINERDQTLIEIPIMREVETTFSIGVVILVENNHRLPQKTRHVRIHLILGTIARMARDRILIAHQ